MTEFVRKVKSLITFDAPFENGYIETLFTSTHQQHQSRMPNWGVDSTRQKLISHYWYSQVTRHFVLLLTLPILIFLFTSGRIDHGHFLVILFGAGLTFGVMLIIHYLPGYIGNFLPKLDAVVNGHRQDQLAKIIACQQFKIIQQQQEIRRLTAAIAMEAEQHFMALEKSKQEVVATGDLINQLNGTITHQKEKIGEYQQEISLLKAAMAEQAANQRMVLEKWNQEAVDNRYRRDQLEKAINLQQEKIDQQQQEIGQLTARLNTEIENKKCRGTQFSTLTLLLIYKVLAIKAGLPPLVLDNQTSQQLSQLFGRHPRGIRDKLAVVLEQAEKYSKDSHRHAVARDQFDEAHDFFEELKYTEGIRILKELECKLGMIRD